MAGNAALPVHEVAATGRVNWRVAVAGVPAESVTVKEKVCIPGAFATVVVPNSLPVVLSAESFMLELPVPPRRFSNTAVSAAVLVLHLYPLPTVPPVAAKVTIGAFTLLTVPAVTQAMLEVVMESGLLKATGVVAITFPAISEILLDPAAMVAGVPSTSSAPRAPSIVIVAMG